MITAIDKIMEDAKFKSFHVLELNDFTNEELTFLKKIYIKFDDKIDKFIEKRNLLKVEKKSLTEIIQELEDNILDTEMNIKLTEYKMLSLLSLTEEEEDEYNKNIESLSKDEQKLKKLLKVRTPGEIK